jgi:hypothetical protein
VYIYIYIYESEERIIFVCQVSNLRFSDLWLVALLIEIQAGILIRNICN